MFFFASKMPTKLLSLFQTRWNQPQKNLIRHLDTVDAEMKLIPISSIMCVAFSVAHLPTTIAHTS
jgi:hypothetical protein